MVAPGAAADSAAGAMYVQADAGMHCSIFIRDDGQVSAAGVLAAAGLHHGAVAGHLVARGPQAGPGRPRDPNPAGACPVGIYKAVQEQDLAEILRP